MIRIDISRMCSELRPAILAALGRQDGALVVEGEISEVKHTIEQVLPKDYIVVENAQEPQELAVLRKGDIEQLGLYLCGFCAMVFGSEIERNVHQRSHYFGFG
jgi:hypothetical protein